MCMCICVLTKTRACGCYETLRRVKEEVLLGFLLDLYVCRVLIDMLGDPS